MVGLLFVLLLHIPNVFQAGTVSNLWLKAFKQSTYEQEVEDINSIHKYDSHLVRRLIVMPLTEVFNPNRMDAMHNKVQYGDKCSLPSSLGKIIFEKPFEVPWLFEITPVQNKNDSKRDNRTYEQASISDDTSDTTSNGESSTAVQPPKLLRKRLQKAYISPLDFRSPENFIFVPKWLMADLNLKPNDLVDISFVRIRLASLVTLQPLTLEWDTLMRVHGDPKSLLEHEINKYSSLTSGSTIIIEIKSVEYPIFVKEVKAENDVSVRGVRVQDSDIKTDIDRGYLDQLIKYRAALKESGADVDKEVSSKSSRLTDKKSKKKTSR